MAPRITRLRPSNLRTPSSAPIIKPTRTTYRGIRKPASPLPAGHVLNSPRYSPSPSPRMANMPGTFPPTSPRKWTTKPLLPFRKTHQFRKYGAYLRFPGAGFLESRLRKIIETEMLGVLRDKVKELKTENEKLRRDWAMQIEVQDRRIRGEGEEYDGEGGIREEWNEQLRRWVAARDRGVVMEEVWRMEAVYEQARERGDEWKERSRRWKVRCRDVEGRLAGMEGQMEVLRGQVEGLTGGGEVEEEAEGIDEGDDDAGDVQERDELEAQFDRDKAVAAAQAPTMNSGRMLRSRGMRG
ncbi:MAG: hypothetical protein Q9169_005681 [Polycauliona sp. 2 TL-2023]